MASPVFRDQFGRLTAYAFACGYVESKSVHHVHIELWREHSTYHVRAHDHGTGKRVFWDSFRTLTEARKRYSKASKESV